MKLWLRSQRPMRVREDHAQHRAGRAPRRHAEAEDEQREPEPSHAPEADAAQARSDQSVSRRARMFRQVSAARISAMRSSSSAPRPLHARSRDATVVAWRPRQFDSSRTIRTSA